MAPFWGVNICSQNRFELLLSLSPLSRSPLQRLNHSPSKSRVYSTFRCLWSVCSFFSLGSPAVDSVEHLKIVATITNTGDETLKVLNDPRGPLNKLPTDTFVITDAKGAQPSFTGIKLKYVPKTAAALGAYTILAPGEFVAVEHDRRYLPRSSFLVCCSHYTFLSMQSLMCTTLLYLERGVMISTQKIPSTLSTPTPRYRPSTPVLIRIPQKFLGS